MIDHLQQVADPRRDFVPLLRVRQVDLTGGGVIAF
jgi:hypothetical protein